MFVIEFALLFTTIALVFALLAPRLVTFARELFKLVDVPPHAATIPATAKAAAAYHLMPHGSVLSRGFCTYIYARERLLHSY